MFDDVSDTSVFPRKCLTRILFSFIYHLLRNMYFIRFILLVAFFQASCSTNLNKLEQNSAPFRERRNLNMAFWKVSDKNTWRVVLSLYDFCKQMLLEILTRGRGSGHTLDTCPPCREYLLSGCSTVWIFSRRSYLPFSSFHFFFFFLPKKPPRRPNATWRTV